MSRLKFKHPGDGRCPCIEVESGKYFIQDRSLDGMPEEHKLFFVPAGGWRHDTGQTDFWTAMRTASKIMSGGEDYELWWDVYSSGYTIKGEDGKRYYLYQYGLEWPRHWWLRCCYDEAEVLVQGGESYREFVAQCEEYVNERHGQCCLWGGDA